MIEELIKTQVRRLVEDKPQWREYNVDYQVSEIVTFNDTPVPLMLKQISDGFIVGHGVYMSSEFSFAVPAQQQLLFEIKSPTGRQTVLTVPGLNGTQPTLWRPWHGVHYGSIQATFRNRFNANQGLGQIAYYVITPAALKSQP